MIDGKTPEAEIGQRVERRAPGYELEVGVDPLPRLRVRINVVQVRIHQRDQPGEVTVLPIEYFIHGHLLEIILDDLDRL